MATRGRRVPLLPWVPPLARVPSRPARLGRPGQASTSKPSAFAQYRALLGKDVRQELRTREMLTSMVVYSLWC